MMMNRRGSVLFLICGAIYCCPWNDVSAFSSCIRRTQPSATRNSVFATHPRSTNKLQMVSESSIDDTGSVLGASLLFAGTAIGAGMLALPAETAASGFVPSVSSLLICWVFTIVTSFVTLEATWVVSQTNKQRQTGFLSITKQALGPVGEVATGLLFWFLLASIVVAYTSEGGQLLSQAADEFLSLELLPQVGSALFVAFFAALSIFGTNRVDLVNRVMVAGLIASFVFLIGVSISGITIENLSRSDWTTVYPQVVSIGILSFGAQNVVPTLFEYLGSNPLRTRQAILLGSIIPLIMYCTWEAVFLGVVPFDESIEGSKMQVVAALGDVGGVIVKDLVEIFSACAIGSSMAGASVSLVDFFQDAIATIREGDEAKTPRLLAASLALAPPLVLACLYPDAFLGALENAGLIGGVSLYGVLPALAVLNLRKKNIDEVMPGRLIGGSAALYALTVVSACLILPDLILLGESVLTS